MAQRKELLLARWKLERCSMDFCPAMIDEDCRNLERELLPRIPSVIPTATNAAGRNLLDTALVIDRNRVLERLGRVSSGRESRRARAPFVALALIRRGVFRVSGFSAKSALKDCRPACSTDEVDAVHTRSLIAEVSFAAALMSAAGATYIGLAPV